MIIIAVVNTKGGVGKTIICSALAVEAARQDGRVGVIDLDPQKSLLNWAARRGSKDNPKDNPMVIDGDGRALDAIESLKDEGFDWVFMDGPPAIMETIAECIGCADLAVIPLKPAGLDLIASEAAFQIAQSSNTPFLCVFNDVTQKEKQSICKEARGFLFYRNHPIADTSLVHRISHIAGTNLGKTAAEVKKKDPLAAGEIAALWQEVKELALKSAEIRDAREKAAAHA